MNEDLELQLRAALSRKDPPLGFAQRTIALAAPPARRPMHVWMSLALAATLLISFGVYRVRERHRADEAKQQLMLALKITSEKLAVVEKALDRSSN
jgi:hypothetical protein